MNGLQPLRKKDLHLRLFLPYAVYTTVVVLTSTLACKKTGSGANLHTAFPAIFATWQQGKGRRR